jgi:mono/diheme cytochrome c family protein
VEGTVARGWLREDRAYYLGIGPDGNLVEVSPVELTMQLLERGQERFDIYCAPCHGKTGGADDIKGIVVQKGMLVPPSFHVDPVLSQPDGHYFDVITNGIRNMPAYKSQIPVEDRWAIVAYMRALQRSQNATLQDIPADQRDKVRKVTTQ